MATAPNAYSYLRFSTPEQMKGDSYRRQTELSRAYADRHKLILDDRLTFQDLGVSAFRGKNSREGALSAFMLAVESGQVRAGSFLLVESLDRLSRDTVSKAFRQFSAITDLGITIVTLTDGKVYTKQSLSENFADLLISLTTMYRAHEESATKSKRLKAAWQGKRNKAQAGGNGKLTGRCPAWLRLDAATSEFVVIQDRADLIKRIFDLTLSGHGKQAIARQFNAEGVPTFGVSDGWHPSYVQKILSSEALVGAFQPMTLETTEGKKVREVDGAPLEGYFPAIIDKDTFLQAQSMRRDRRIEGGPKGERFSNLFTGLAVCGSCGAPMHFINKGEGEHYLVCSNKRRKVSDCTFGGGTLTLEVTADGTNWAPAIPAPASLTAPGVMVWQGCALGIRAKLAGSTAPNLSATATFVDFG